jgi:hypothetical protein
MPATGETHFRLSARSRGFAADRSPFDGAEMAWQGFLDRLEEEDVSLTAEQRRTVRPIFDRLWANYRVL